MIKKFQPLLAILTLFMGTAFHGYSQNQININSSVSFQKISGIGTMDLYPNAVDDIECTAMRINFSPESTPGLEMSGNENNDLNVLDISKFKHDAGMVSRAKYAKSKGIELYLASVWSPPGWMKDMSSRTPATLEWWSPCNYAANATWCGGFLKPTMYDEYAEWLVGCIKSWKAETGIDLSAISLQNEPEFPEPYGSCVYTPDELYKLLLVVGKRFTKDGITTKIVYGEILWAQNNINGFFTPVLKSTEALSYLKAFALHNYDTDGIKVGGPSTSQWQTTALLANKGQKELWMTETSGHSVDVTGMMTLAGQMYTALNAGNINAWFYYDFDLKNKYVLNLHKQFAKFIRPGAIRIEGVSTNPDILTLTFAHPVSKNMTVLLINRNAGSLNTFIKASNLPQKFGVTVVNSSGNYAVQDSISSSATISLPSNSITVLNGKNPNLVLSTDDKNEVNFYQASLYPNPALENISIEASEAISGKATITDLLGKEILNFDIDIPQFSSFHINLAGLSKGLYVISITGKKAYKSTFIKQ